MTRTPIGNDTSPITNRPLMKRLQADLRGGAEPDRDGVGSLIGQGAGADGNGAFDEFDRIYKPYVFHVLKNVYHFADTTTTTAEDIYHDVLVKLLDGLLLRFDFDRETVGSGAFRCYLKLIVQSAYVRRVSPDLIPALDENGNPEYLDEFETDKSGKAREDEDGRPIRKRKMISRLEFLDTPDVLAKFDGSAKARARRGPHEGLSKPVVRLAVVAYIKAIYEKEQKGKAPWRLQAMKEIFEELRDPREVCEELQRNGTIRNRQAFDTAKSIFMDEWETARYILQDPVIETTVDGQAVALRETKTGKVEVLIPRPRMPDGKKSYSREVRRRLKVGYEELEAYISRQESEAARLVGRERAEAIGRGIGKAMAMLMQEADAKEAEKNAGDYR